MARMTRDIAKAIGLDAGNKSMKSGGRTEWNEDDYNAASEAFTDALILVLTEEGN